MTINVPALTGTPTNLPVTLHAALDGAADFARAEKATATQRAYKSDFLRQRWPNTRTVWRGDSHYGRVEAMEWIEENDGDYIFGPATRRLMHWQPRQPTIFASIMPGEGAYPDELHFRLAVGRGRGSGAALKPELGAERARTALS